MAFWLLFAVFSSVLLLPEPAFGKTRHYTLDVREDLFILCKNVVIVPEGLQMT